MNKAKREAIFARLQEAIPEPTTELLYDTPFQLLIAVILSAQATDVSVNKGTRTLFPEAPDPTAMAKLGIEGVSRHIRHIGLFNSKAKNVVATCEILLKDYGGEVPRDRKAL